MSDTAGFTDDPELIEPLEAGHCPDCRYRGFVLGPWASPAINIECGNIECRARFNVVMFASRVVFAHRIERDVLWQSEPRQAPGLSESTQ